MLGHILSETLASGRNPLAVAAEPSHLVLLILSLAAGPLWFRAAASRRLGQAVFGFIALSLLVEGNGLSASALAAAIAITALWSWLTARALEYAGAARGERARYRGQMPLGMALTAGATPAGPYFGYVRAYGSRPPPPR